MEPTIIKFVTSTKSSTTSETTIRIVETCQLSTRRGDDVYYCICHRRGYADELVDSVLEDSSNCVTQADDDSEDENGEDDEEEVQIKFEGMMEAVKLNKVVVFPFG
mmetsp:Transcript_35159/g.63268  ORF Transcript_35159/g.63268 Transcript_35159/m.63268 type:complete len:106 (+) Transcript_35159:579-896(+)